MSGTKFDQNKAPLVYNYWDGICTWLSADQLHEVVNNIMQIHANLVIDNTEASLSTINTTLDIEATRLKISQNQIIHAVSQVCKMGADKYGHYNYRQGINYDRLLSAALRHRIQGPMNLDNESGLPHWAHFFSNLLMLIELIKIGKYK